MGRSGLFRRAPGARRPRHAGESHRTLSSTIRSLHARKLLCRSDSSSVSIRVRSRFSSSSRVRVLRRMESRLCTAHRMDRGAENTRRPECLDFRVGSEVGSDLSRFPMLPWANAAAFSASCFRTSSRAE